MQNKKSYYTVQEIFEYVNTIDSNIKTILSVDSYSSSALKLIKKLIVLCNSVSITLLQQEKLEEAIHLLRVSDNTDAELLKFGAPSKWWQGRVIAPCILAYLYFTQQRFIDSLKFLYKVHSFVQEFKDNGAIIHNQIKNLINILTFMVLWKMGRYPEAEKYIDAVGGFDMDSIRGRNVFGIITMSKAGLIVKKKKEYLNAIQACEDAVKILDQDEVTCDLLKTLTLSLYSEMKKNTAEDWLISTSYITVVYVTCFIPLIASGTPIMKEDYKPQLDSSYKYIRPSFSASRTRPEAINLQKLLNENQKNIDNVPLTSRRSRLNTSRDRLSVNSVPKSSVQIMTTRSFASGSSKVYNFSPRIITKVERPKSSRISLKNKAYNVYK